MVLNKNAGGTLAHISALLHCKCIYIYIYIYSRNLPTDTAIILVSYTMFSSETDKKLETNRQTLLIYAYERTYVRTYAHTVHAHKTYTILTVTLCSGGIACALTELCPTVNR